MIENAVKGMIDPQISKVDSTIYYIDTPQYYNDEVLRREIGRETKGNKWLKWILIEASWSHLRLCPNGRLARVFEKAYKRKRDKKKAIKIVARKLVNIIWAVWKYGREFDINFC
jgi:hypothetical protein